MAVVSYNQEEMQEILDRYEQATNVLGNAQEIIQKNVQIIKEKWQGTDASKAYADLDAVNNLMANIVNNVATVYNALEEVHKNFGQLKWTESQGEGGN